MTEEAVAESITIPARFNGPLGSGNGGYTCGVIAGLVDGVAEVTLRSPPPLDSPLRAIRRDGSILVFDGGTLIAEAAVIEPWEAATPPAPSLAEAEEATRHYAGHTTHEFPTCFVCGPQRSDGLGVFPGPAGGGAVAAPWRPDSSLPLRDGTIADEIVWAALDCPGAWSAARDFTVEPVVLGRMSAQLLAPILPDVPYVVFAWETSAEGRKSFTGTAIAAADGTVLATARQTWLTLQRR